MMVSWKKYFVVLRDH